jgi:cell division transport system permease protein
MAAIGIAIALPMELLLMDQSTSAIARSIDAADLSIYLSPKLVDTEVNRHITALSARPDIVVLRIISPAQGLAELTTQPELKSALMALPDQSLPTTVIARPRLTQPLTAQRLRVLADELRAVPGVDQVRSDIDWFTRVQQASDAGRQLLGRLLAGLSLAAVILIGAILRGSLLAYREDQMIEGAMPNRGPLIYVGAMVALGGGAMACALPTMVTIFLAKPISTFLLAIGILAQAPAAIGSLTVLMLLVLSTLVGAMTAFVLTFTRAATQGKRSERYFSK